MQINDDGDAAYQQHSNAPLRPTPHTQYVSLPPAHTHTHALVLALLLIVYLSISLYRTRSYRIVNDCSNKERWGMKEWSFWIVGIITFLYVVAELGVALYVGSLTLLSDGFHNLSDVLALYIAFWASQVRGGVRTAVGYSRVRARDRWLTAPCHRATGRQARQLRANVVRLGAHRDPRSHGQLHLLAIALPLRAARGHPEAHLARADGGRHLLYCHRRCWPRHQHARHHHLRLYAAHT